MRRGSTDVFVVVALLLLCGVVRALFIGLNELAHDEPFTLYWAHRPLGELFAQLRTENNPPLHFLLVKVWLPIAGSDVTLLRMPSAMFSALTVWPLFLLGREFGGRLVGFTAALLFTCSSYHQGFAHEVRAYTLFALLAAVGMWQLARIARKEDPPHWGWLAAVNIAMVYTHFFGWTMLGVQALCVLLIRDLRTARRGWLLATGATLLAYAPYAVVFAQRLATSVSEGTWLTAPEPEELYNMIWRWSNAPVIAVLLLLVIVAVSAQRRGRTMFWAMGLCWTLVLLLGMFAASFIAPMFLDRYLIHASLGFYLLAAYALHHAFPQRTPGLVLAGAAVVAMAFTFEPDRSNGLRPSRVRAVVEAMGKGAVPVLIAPPWYAITYAWYLDPSLFRDPARLEQALAGRDVHAVRDAASIPPHFSEADTVMVVDSWSALTDPEGSIDRRLRTTHPLVDEVEADDHVFVRRYRR
ncbi:MAG: glycosyltransferase family 39 protein [Flavobacteriales bacterium]|nr:glycosyltransferase family 39 protein [Flavobacteriales bacterium]